MYGGCQGNNNNFKSVQECIEMCNSSCPEGFSKIRCSSDFCKTSSCPNYPDALCVVRSCGQCSVHYYNASGVEITEMCSSCPPEKPKVSHCLINPCDHQQCLNFPQAKCVVERCGICKAKFILNGTDITSQCRLCQAEGEVFRSCKSCHQTCNDTVMRKALICSPTCIPSCSCPAGQVLDESLNRCVSPAMCLCPPCAPLPPNCTHSVIPQGTKCGCPICTDCPIDGQVFKESDTLCPRTCSNPHIVCHNNNASGCSCPEGQVIDEQKQACVNINNCPRRNPCNLGQYIGPCNSQILRFFYNATSQKCEKFFYGGCFANENNFFSLHDCEEKCSDCPPTCTLEFCTIKRKAMCSINSSQSSSLCPGGCALSNCQACYYSYNKLPLPTGAESCPAQCKIGNNMIDENCAAKWGRCLRSIFYATYNQIEPRERIASNYHCWDYPCSQ